MHYHKKKYGFLCDNVGENISERNPYWSEWTALFWGWNNLHNIKYLGLNHYRRYFDYEISDDNIESLLKGYDMIVVKSKKNIFKNQRLENLIHITSQEDAYIFLDTLLFLHPECKEALLQYFYNSRESYPFSMFISSKELYDDYCNFIFPVLFETEKRLKSHLYTRQKRTIGYFGEWSLGIFIFYKHLRVKKIPIIMYGKKDYHSCWYKEIARLFINSFYTFVNYFEPVPDNIYVPDAVKVGLKSDGIELKAL